MDQNKVFKIINLFLQLEVCIREYFLEKLKDTEAKK